MFIIPIALKLGLSSAAFYFIIHGSPWVVLVFLGFIFLDLLDGEVMGPKYRPYDTLFDRVFAYLCFTAYFFSGAIIYPAIIYISCFLIRDYFVLSEIQESGNYLVKSNLLDRLTMLVSAVFFSFEAGGLFHDHGFRAELLCYAISFLILYQGLDKIKRIRAQTKETA